MFSRAAITDMSDTKSVHVLNKLDTELSEDTSKLDDATVHRFSGADTSQGKLGVCRDEEIIAESHPPSRCPLN